MEWDIPATLIGYGSYKDANCATLGGSATVIDFDLIAEGSMLNVGEGNKCSSIGSKIKSDSEIHLRSLPEGQKNIVLCSGTIQRYINRVDLNV